MMYLSTYYNLKLFITNLKIKIMKFCKKVLLSSIILLGFLIMNSQLTAQERTRTKVKKVVKRSKVLPLNAKLFKLDRTATRTLAAWKKAKKFRLLSNGNFVPLVQNSQNTNFPSLGGDLSFAIDCVKIECPDVFEDGVTCWECH